MAPQSGIFPIFLRAEYREDANGIPKFISRVQQAAKISEAELARVGNALNKALSAPRTGSGSLDLGTAQLREQIKAQEQAAVAAREIAVATRATAIANGDLSKALVPTIRAYFDVADAKDADVRASRAQLAALEAVQAQLNQTASATTVLTGENLRLAQAEAGAANGANMIAATLRGTALEQGRVANSARESARAFEELFAAQDAAAQAAAASQQRLAASAAQLRAELDPMFAAQQRFDQELARADALLEAGTISTREYAAAQQLARDNLRQAAQAATQTAEATERVRKVGTTATQNVINSQRASRTAFIQLGQQMQDVAVQAQLGTNALTIFTQQLPQAAFALTGLADSSNKTKASIGQFAQILSGPVGGAIVIATALLGPFIVELFKSGDAAESAAKSVSELVEEKKRSAAEARNAAIAEDVFSRTLDGVTDAARRNREAILKLTDAKRSDSEETLRNSRIQLANALALQFNTQQQLFNAKALLDAQVARATGPGQAAELATFGIADKQAALDKTLANLITGAGEIAKIQNDINAAAILVSVDRGLSGAEGEIKRRYEAEVEGLKKTAAARGLSSEQIEREAAAIKAREQAALRALKPGSGGSDAAAERRRATAANQLAKFGERAAEQIQRINERFDEQPRLIDAAAQATRQLDGIIADLEKRKPLGFEDLMRNAQDAKRTVEEALLRPIQQIRQESEQRLAIEEALALGQFDRAAALQEIFRLEQQIGLLNEDQRSEIEDIVVAEQQRLRVLRDQQAVFNAQLGVVDEVRRSLTDLLSGRSSDFFGTFRQALRDLQGQRLFEAIFGQTFRDIENELQANTPQGRANKALADQTNKTTSTVTRLEQSLDGLSDAVSRTRDRLLSDFDSEFGAANDNGGFSPRFAIAEAAMRAIGQDPYGIRVPGQRPDETGITRRSIADLAKLISSGVGSSIAALFKDVLGERFAEVLGDTIGGFIAGKTLGGTTGGILGALQGGLGLFADKDGKLSKGLQGLSDALGEAGAGAAIGTQVAGIGKAFGLKGSTTGAQIGGAIGSFIPIPGGQIIGAIAGNIIGGLFKKKPRASARIGGVGGSLGVTGVRGNKAGLRDAVSDLAGSVLDSINSIAQQLGATVDSSAGSVSIGIRKGNLRVDKTGQGRTKTKRGAIDFGDDAEGAVRAAVLDLIQDGVIKGLRASEERLLRAAKDVESGVRNALTFRSVFDRLREIKDPVGAAVEQVNREFDGLRDLFKRAGASAEEFASLEELYNLQRAEAIKEATDRVVGSLRQLLSDLTIGDSGLSLRDRRSNALGQFNALAGRVAAGDTSAFDDFADISQQLLDIERQLFGSTQAYFDRLNQITALTERAIADQTNVTSIGAGAPSPSDDRASIARTIEATSAEQLSVLRAINDNLVTALNPALRPVITGGGGGRSELTSFPAFIANF